MPKTKLIPLSDRPRKVSGLPGRARTIAIPKMFFLLTGIDPDAELTAELFLDGKKIVVVLTVGGAK